MPDPFIASVSASGPRRYFGVGVLASLGIVILWTTFNAPPPGLGARAFLVLSGLVALFGAAQMWRATERVLVLTETGLGDDTGAIFARWDDMARVDRGMLAFKPSNGFILTLRTPGPRAWAPGLYWRMGRRIGVGGVTAAAEAKMMADIIALKLAERDGV